MRKTKLIILPTKCLNRMGFLLLFLSCPVIGDWGRIRPDSEMSQWSIQIEREGSCGLVRDSPGIKDSTTADGLMECYAADAMLRNNTPSLIETAETDFIFHPQFPVHESRIERRNVRLSTVQIGERRVGNVRQERSYRRSTQTRNINTERRAVSLDRQASFRYDERLNDVLQREVRLDRSSRARADYRRISRSLGRRVDARRSSPERRVRGDNERLQETVRRLSVSREERDVNQRRDDIETARRSIENERRSREVRLSQSRNEHRIEEQRLTRRALQTERNDARRNIARRVREDRYDSERRGRREERKSQEERTTREVRSADRSASSERRIRASDIRERVERDIRTARRNAETDRRVRDTAEISRRREGNERNIRALTGRELPERSESDLSRKQEVRLSIRRMDKPDDLDGISRSMRQHREKSAMFNYRVRHDKTEPLNLKNEMGQWQFLDGLKTFFRQKSDKEERVSNHGNFATTCLVGAAVYFLTARQVKT